MTTADEPLLSPMAPDAMAAARWLAATARRPAAAARWPAAAAMAPARCPAAAAADNSLNLYERSEGEGTKS